MRAEYHDKVFYRRLDPEEEIPQCWNAEKAIWRSEFKMAARNQKNQQHKFPHKKTLAVARYIKKIHIVKK